MVVRIRRKVTVEKQKGTLSTPLGSQSVLMIAVEPEVAGSVTCQPSLWIIIFMSISLLMVCIAIQKYCFFHKSFSDFSAVNSVLPTHAWAITWHFEIYLLWLSPLITSQTDRQSVSQTDKCHWAEYIALLHLACYFTVYIILLIESSPSTQHIDFFFFALGSATRFCNENSLVKNEFPYYDQICLLWILRNAYPDIYIHFFWNETLQWLFEYWLCILLNLQTSLSPFTFCICICRVASLEKHLCQCADKSTPWPNDFLLFAIIADFFFFSVFRILCAHHICLPLMLDFSMLSKASFSSLYLIAFGNAFKSRADLDREGLGCALDKSFCLWFIKIFHIF